MAIEVATSGEGRMAEAIDVLRSWQSDDGPLQLHPGDVGWNWQFGEDSITRSMRIWSDENRIVAIGMGDDDVIRMTIAPELRRDRRVAERIVADLADPATRVLGEGQAGVELPSGTLAQELLLDLDGWNVGEAWTPLSRDLSVPVEDCGLRIETVDPAHPTNLHVYTAVHRSAFGSPRFTDEVWHTLAKGLPFKDARSIIGFDPNGNAVAMATVWSAGVGRPGIIEPLGGHADFRGNGYGRGISVACAAVLRDIGASSAQVCTPSANVGAVAAYVSAGYATLPERFDTERSA